MVKYITLRKSSVLHTSDSDFMTTMWCANQRSTTPPLRSSLLLHHCSLLSNRSTFAGKASGITYHHFPREPSLRLSWEHAIGTPDLVPTKHSVVCSKHFRNEDFDRTSLTRVRLREGAVPIPSLQVQQLLGKVPDVAGVSDPEPSAQEARALMTVHEVADMPSVPPSPALVDISVGDVHEDISGDSTGFDCTHILTCDEQNDPLSFTDDTSSVGTPGSSRLSSVGTSPLASLTSPSTSRGVLVTVGCHGELSSSFGICAC
ncbi:THAP domain-containing protein 1-like [Ornithodoros turicata]|uniref:THAP domain-containing protein 1-like n=1 Tax=Ornithodoros turicata TaxID=34597 RepID=UPI00313943BE